MAWFTSHNQNSYTGIALMSQFRQDKSTWLSMLLASMYGINCKGKYHRFLLFPSISSSSACFSSQLLFDRPLYSIPSSTITQLYVFTLCHCTIVGSTRATRIIVNELCFDQNTTRTSCNVQLVCCFFGVCPIRQYWGNHALKTYMTNSHYTDTPCAT